MRAAAMTALLALATSAACFDSDRPPPCSEDDGIQQGPGGPVHGPADPGPGFPAPLPDGDTEPRYRLNEAGEVCACGLYELGCVDSPEKARASAKAGAHCPYPRESGDPVLGGDGVRGEVFRDPSRPYCKCWWTFYDVCGNQNTSSIEIYGDDAAACEDKLSSLLGMQNAGLAESGASGGHDLASIQCVSR